MNLLTNSDDFQASRELHIQVNPAGIIVKISPNCFEILGFTEKKILNSSINKLLDYGFDDLIVHKSIQTVVSNKNGQKLFFDVVSSTLVDDDIQIIGLNLSLINISKYINTQEPCYQFVKIFQEAKDIIFKYQLIPECKFISLSPSISDILGYDTEDYFINPSLVFELVHPDDVKIQKNKMDKCSDFSKTFQVRFKHIDGQYIWLEDYLIPTFDNNGDLVSVEGISRNIQQTKELEEKLEALSYHDGLTGLYNRTYLNKQIEILISDISISIGIIVCDLDNLKYINDSLGHSAGDILIKNVSTFFTNAFSEDCTIVRSGGDEFIIIIPNTSLKQAEDLYSKMLYSIDMYNENNEMSIQLSSGFAHSSFSKTIFELLSIADKDMYKNKLEKKQGMRD